ncbi:MAG: hypothetical protein Q8S60_02655 [Parvibaculum sp.]|nr:hypothetical protein [Parvibaculum sp.]
MIVHKRWCRGAGATSQLVEGWFFLGIIPLFIRELCVKGGCYYRPDAV